MQLPQTSIVVIQDHTQPIMVSNKSIRGDLYCDYIIFYVRQFLSDTDLLNYYLVSSVFGLPLDSSTVRKPIEMNELSVERQYKIARKIFNQYQSSRTIPVIPNHPIIQLFFNAYLESPFLFFPCDLNDPYLETIKPLFKSTSYQSKDWNRASYRQKQGGFALSPALPAYPDTARLDFFLEHFETIYSEKYISKIFPYRFVSWMYNNTGKGFLIFALLCSLSLFTVSLTLYMSIDCPKDQPTPTAKKYHINIKTERAR